MSTSSLEPQPIPLSIKVVLTGERWLYYLLNQYDPEFRDLFKVCADFDDAMPRDGEGERRYAHWLGSLARQDNLLPLTRGAAARMVEHASRLAEDRTKLSTHLRSLHDLLQEADHWAARAGRTVVDAADIEHAIEQQKYRTGRIRERMREMIERGVLLVATEGAVVGQANGLSVLSLGDATFGQPSRITATTRLGNGKIIDIERETELGGAFHSKGVMILSSFLAERYAKSQPFSVAASLAFEQSYGPVDGDSASLAETCAILSSLADVPIRQNYALTGSLDQHGQVQPIGGVNEKIEGFFDVCKARGLSGEQAVIIPRPNVDNLMLRADVVDAVRSGRFHIHAVATVDETLHLLTGQEAGAPDTEGGYPAESVNGRIDRRLREFVEIQKRVAGRNREGNEDAKSGP
jgi:lon-related putative ATP-dependent protease